jgi:hypothetical protein
MIGDYVRSLDGVATLGVVMLVVSLAFFVAIVVRVLRTPKEHVNRLSQLPFEDEQSGTANHREVAP